MIKKDLLVVYTETENIYEPAWSSVERGGYTSQSVVKHVFIEQKDIPVYTSKRGVKFYKTVEVFPKVTTTVTVDV